MKTEPIKKEDIITQQDADIIMAKAMIKAYTKEIKTLEDKIFNDYGIKLRDE